MKKIPFLTFGVLFALVFSFGAITKASAQTYYSYQSTGCTSPSYGYNYGYAYSNCTYQNNTQASYYYTSGCYTYYYNGYTRSTSVVSYNCQVQNTQTYTYTNPVQYSYYTSPYYTYGYERSNATWYPRYNNSVFFNGSTNEDYYTTYNSGHVYTPTTSCYYVNGVYTCY